VDQVYFQALGSSQNLSVGDPVCATEHATISQACVQLVCDLYTSKNARWYDVITGDVITRLNKLPGILEKANISNTTSCSGI